MKHKLITITGWLFLLLSIGLLLYPRDHFFYPTKRIRPGYAEIRRKHEQREKE